MDRIPLLAQERQVLGKKVKKFRKDGLIPGNVYGKGLESEHVFIKSALFNQVFIRAGQTGLIDLKIGTEKVKPVLIRDLQYDPVRGQLLHIDFYQVNLLEKVRVNVPIILIGDEAELVHLGEAVVLNPVSEIEVEALPGDLIDKVEVDITPLKAVDDAITVGELNLDREKITVITPEEEVVVKLAPAITEEMQKLIEEQAAEAAAAVETEAAEGEVAEGEKVEGEEGVEGETVEGEGGEESSPLGVRGSQQSVAEEKTETKE